MDVGVLKVAEFLCPGRRGPVSRAVHLARVAAGDPLCRQCPHWDDRAGLSPRLRQKIEEARQRPEGDVRCEDECIAGIVRNAVDSATARRLAVELAVQLRRRQPELATMPVVVVAGDGRPATAEILAALSDGVRWAGCHVVEAGAVTSPCMVHGMSRLGADGGIYVGQPPREPRDVGLKFWIGREPLSAGGALEGLLHATGGSLDRPTRKYGLRRRYEADRPYLADLADHYHGLRPLRFTVETTCEPVLRDLRTLLRPTACELVVGGPVHFRVSICDDGESCHWTDECGKPVSAERLFFLLARNMLSRGASLPVGRSCTPSGLPNGSKGRQEMADPESQPAGAVILERETRPSFAKALRAMGIRVVIAGPRRGEMAQAMRRHGAALGGGPSGRIWHAASGEGDDAADGAFPVADALTTLTLLLVLLSRSDRPLSGVLDTETPFQ